MSAITNPVPASPSPQEQRLSPAPPPLPVPPESSPWKKWLIALLLVAAVGIGLYQYLKPAPAAPVTVVARTATVTTGTFERSVRLTGQTAALNFSNVVAPILRGPEGGRALVLLKLAKSGGWVKKGDLLVEIDAQTLKDHIDDVQDTVEASDADINKRKAEQEIEWQQLEQTVRIAKSDLDKARLDAKAAEVRTELERQLMALSMDEAEARFKQLQNDLGFKKQAHAAELKILELTRERHVRHRDRHKGDLSRFTIYAPMDGLAVMSTIFRGGDMSQIQVGDQVTPGQPIMKVVDPRRMAVEATVNQATSADLRINQAARVHLDAFGGLKFPGKVYMIGALAVGGWRQNYYIRSVPVRVEIEGYEERLIPDLSAGVDIILDQKPNSLMVPLGAVREEGQEPVVEVKTANGFEKRKVQLGERNQTAAVVLAGLRSGEEVRLN